MAIGTLESEITRLAAAGAAADREAARAAFAQLREELGLGREVVGQPGQRLEPRREGGQRVDPFLHPPLVALGGLALPPDEGGA